LINKVIFSCLLGIGSATVYGQSSITLYGIVDSGVLYKTGVSPAGGSSVALASGIESTSRWGIKGVEDLGNGLQATFNLEEGFKVNNGTQNVSGVEFDRPAYVGLKGPWGWVTLGKNTSPFMDALSAIDLSGFSNFGSLNNITCQTATGYTCSQSYWVNNSIKYTAPTINGLSGSAMYTLGGKAGDNISERVMSARLVYEQGPVAGNLAYFNGRDPSGITDARVATDYTVGIRGQIGGLKLTGDFSNFRNPSTGSNQNYYAAQATYLRGPWVFNSTYIHLTDRVHSTGDANLFSRS
jgi:predicted porin